MYLLWLKTLISVRRRNIWNILSSNIRQTVTTTSLLITRQSYNKFIQKEHKFKYVCISKPGLKISRRRLLNHPVGWGKEYYSYMMYCTKNVRSRIWKLWAFRCRVKVGKCHLYCDKNDVHIFLICSETERWRQIRSGQVIMRRKPTINL